MNILFVSTALSESGSATGVLIGNLIDAFHGKGCRVDCLTIKRSLYDSDITEYRGATVYHANYVTSFRPVRKSPRDIVLASLKKVTGHNRRTQLALNDSWQVKALLYSLRKINAGEYDLIIAVCACHDAVEAALTYREKAHCNIKILLMQFDPLAENFSLQSKSREMLVAYEREIYEKCDYVFSAPFILAQKSSDWLSEKVIASELPAIVKHAESNGNFDGYINCVYAGDLYRGIRDPHFMLKLFTRFKNNRIRLYILSNGEKELLTEYANGALRDRLFIIGRVGEEECNRWLNNADVFINLGNNVRNQLPSKILNYMCYGKMILNLYAIADCPTLPYMNRYDLSINVFEKSELTDEMVERIEAQITSEHNKHVSFEKVKDNFITCTPEYVAKRVLSAFNKE